MSAMTTATVSIPQSTRQDGRIVFLTTQLGYIFDVFDFALFPIVATLCLAGLLNTENIAMA